MDRDTLTSSSGSSERGSPPSPGGEGPAPKRSKNGARGTRFAVTYYPAPEKEGASSTREGDGEKRSPSPSDSCPPLGDEDPIPRGDGRAGSPVSGMSPEGERLGAELRHTLMGIKQVSEPVLPALFPLRRRPPTPRPCRLCEQRSPVNCNCPFFLSDRAHSPCPVHSFFC